MSQVEIERLALRVEGLAPGESSQLARRIGDGLAAWRPPPDLALTVDRLRVRVASGTNESLDQLGDRIAAALVRELERTS